MKHGECKGPVLPEPRLNGEQHHLKYNFLADIAYMYWLYFGQTSCNLVHTYT